MSTKKRSKRKQIKCNLCDGCGTLPVFNASGPFGNEICRDCQGKGLVWVTENGALARGPSKWQQITCTSCGGHGMVSAYSMGGMDFDGPEECRDCNGSGHIWMSEKGALAQYPGGPFVGRVPIKWDTA